MDIRKLFLATIAACAAFTTTNAQDKLASVAPVDVRMEKVDTLVLNSLRSREVVSSPAVNLYNEWSNRYAHKAEELPDSFNISLRHFCMPTDSRVVTSHFGRRWGRMHKGLDIKVYIGDTIRSAFDGKVRITSYQASGYGYYVVIRHPNGLETIYGHMSKNLVVENQVVRAGDPIGLGGNTGRSTGSHLHFETRLCGLALNPALMFDFANQDVTADSYIFRKSQHSVEVSNHNKMIKKTLDTNTAIAKNDVSQNANEKQNTESNDVAANKQIATMDANENRIHVVKRGDTLYSIARVNGTTVDELCKKNNMSRNSKLVLGKVLKI